MDSVVNILKTALADSGGLEGSLTLVVKDIGSIFINGATVHKSNSDADCTVTISQSDFIAINNGTIDPLAVFLSGHIDVTGDASMALALLKILNSKS